MDFPSLILIALALGMDAFSVALAVGAAWRRIAIRPLFRLSFHFGLFQLLMPIVGWQAGMTFAGIIEPYDHWLAFGLLALVGGKMIHEALRGQAREKPVDLTRGLPLIVLAIATSIDALAVGLSLAFLNLKIIYPSLVIGLTAMIMTAIGFVAGGRLGLLLGKKAELLGGMILLAIGLKILLEHLFP